MGFFCERARDLSEVESSFSVLICIYGAVIYVQFLSDVIGTREVDRCTLCMKLLIFVPYRVYL